MCSLGNTPARRSCTRQGELNEAAELCAAATRTAPRNARARYLRGAVAQRAGRGREAAEYACEAARLRPDLPALQLAAGSLLYRGKEYASALRVYEGAIEKDPADARYHLGGGYRSVIVGCGRRILFIRLFFAPFNTLALLFSLLPSRTLDPAVTQEAFLPPPHYGTCLHFCRE